MRRVHVDEHEPGAVLREHVDAVQLREREAERMVVAGLGQRGRVAALALAEQPRVERRRLGRRERERVLRAASRPRRRRPSGGVRAADEAEALGGRHRGRFGRARGERALDRGAHELVHRAPSRKRTSLFCGCTFTSTRRGSIVSHSAYAGWRSWCSTSR